MKPEWLVVKKSAVNYSGRSNS